MTANHIKHSDWNISGKEIWESFKIRKAKTLKQFFQNMNFQIQATVFKIIDREGFRRTKNNILNIGNV